MAILKRNVKMTPDKKGKKPETFPKIKIKVFSADLTGFRKEKEYYVENTQTKIMIGVKEGLGYYLVQDPPVTEDQLELLEKTAGELIYSEFKKDEDIKKRLGELKISPGLKYLIMREISEDRYSSLDPLMHDPNIESIECTGADVSLTVKYYGIGRLTTNLKYNADELDQLVQRLAYKAAKTISKANPRIDNARLPDGSRLAASYMGEIAGSSTFTIKKFPKTGWTPTKLMKNNTLTPEIAAILWIFMENKMPMLVCGEMDSGKTSLANSICGFTRPTVRIGTIEDVPEFKLPVRPESWLRYFTRESLTSDGKPITTQELLKQILRAVVDYIVVNEVRSEEDVPTWINAIAAGSGGITTFHAPNFEDLCTRMQHIGLKKEELIALRGGIIFIKKVSEMGKRRITEIGHVILHNGETKFEVFVSYDVRTDSYSIDFEKLMSSKTVKYLWDKAGIDFKEELEKRTEYLKWLRNLADSDPNVLEPDGFLGELKKYYSNPEYYKDQQLLPRQVFEEVETKDNVQSTDSAGIDVTKPKPIRVSPIRKQPAKIKHVKEGSKTGPGIKKTKKHKKRFWSRK
ncbi:type II/IV secretion system ATPase subunit [Candidatus Bathyarchaeota archaeon]|nr:type II/IV secretion system ATPase subunit [Candidatus Bathyarchaeota archaeon]